MPIPWRSVRRTAPFCTRQARLTAALAISRNGVNESSCPGWKQANRVMVEFDEVARIYDIR
jgi:hypothetical protein